MAKSEKSGSKKMTSESEKTNQTLCGKICPKIRKTKIPARKLLNKLVIKTDFGKENPNL